MAAGQQDESGGEFYHGETQMNTDWESDFDANFPNFREFMGFNEFGRLELRVKRIRQAVLPLPVIFLRPGTGALR